MDLKKLEELKVLSKKIEDYEFHLEVLENVVRDRKYDLDVRVGAQDCIPISQEIYGKDFLEKYKNRLKEKIKELKETFENS